MRFHGTMRVNGQGHLEIGGCDGVNLAREFGTPLYVIDEELFRQNCQFYYQAFTLKYGAEVIYAAKSLFTLAICRLVEEEKLGLDVVSGGELYTAIQAGFPMKNVYFHGNNKSPSELKMALKAGISRIIVDNFYELDLLDKLAFEMAVKAHIVLRVTPGVEAHTHEYIKTGQIDSKFGLVIDNGQAMEGIKKALEKQHVILHGLHCHIGSQIFECESYAHAARLMMAFVEKIYKEAGYMVAELNLGGGLGIYYAEDDHPCPVQEYADVIMSTVQEEAAKYNLPVPKIIVEPGRSISGPAGTTFYTVGAVKNIPDIRKYVAVDGGIGDNPRLALYQSRYEACLANKASCPTEETVSIAGKYCESGDMLIWDIALPRVENGDILAVSCTGAYNYTMSMNYNRLPRPAMVLVKDGEAELIVYREDYMDLLRNDLIPGRLRKTKVKSVTLLKEVTSNK